MVAAFRAVLEAARRYGTPVVNWVRNNSGRVYQWIRDGLAVDAIIQRILEILGLD